MQHFVHVKGRLSYKARNPHQRELFSPTEDTVPELTGLSSLTCLHNHELVKKYVTSPELYVFKKINVDMWLQKEPQDYRAAE